jgi:hypothetical protein
MKKTALVRVLHILMPILVSLLLGPIFAQAAETSVCDVSGIWNATWGEMYLFQSGSGVTGNYTWDDGRLEGSLSGSTFTGRWFEAPSYSEPRDAGDVEFTFSENCTSFSGKWRYGSSGNWSEDWSGTKLQGEEEWDKIEELIDEGLDPLCEVEGEGDLLGHIVSHSGDVKIIRKGEDITDTFAFVETLDPSGEPLKMLPIFQGDTIITGDSGSFVEIRYYNYDIRSGWQKTMKFYHWDKYGNPMTPSVFEVHHKEEDLRAYYNSLSKTDQYGYMMALRRNSDTMILGAYTQVCSGDYLEKSDKRKGIGYVLTRGTLWLLGNPQPGLRRSPDRVSIRRNPLPGTAADGIIGFRGTEIIVEVDPQMDSISYFVNEGAITVTSPATGETWNVSEGEMLVNDEGQEAIGQLGQQKWLDLVEQIGHDDNTEDELTQQLAEQGIYLTPPEERELLRTEYILAVIIASILIVVAVAGVASRRRKAQGALEKGKDESEDSK